MGGDSIDVDKVVDDLVDRCAQATCQFTALSVGEVEELPDQLSIKNQAVRVVQFRNCRLDSSAHMTGSRDRRHDGIM